jgi:hypothetical protein
MDFGCRSFVPDMLGPAPRLSASLSGAGTDSADDGEVLHTEFFLTQVGVRPSVRLFCLMCLSMRCCLR